MKSYVSLEQRLCLVCTTAFDTNALLLDKRLHASMEHRTVIGWGLCPVCEKLHNDGYVALVACDVTKSKKDAHGTISPNEAYRLGDIAHVKRSVFGRMFDVPAPEGPLAFVEQQVIDMLKAHEDQDEHA